MPPHPSFCPQDSSLYVGLSHPSRKPHGQALLRFFKKDFIYFFLERGEGREKERERYINVWLPLAHPHRGTWPATQARALTRNQTGEPLVRRLELNPLSHSSQGSFRILSCRKTTLSMVCGCSCSMWPYPQGQPLRFAFLGRGPDTHLHWASESSPCQLRGRAAREKHSSPPPDLGGRFRNRTHSNSVQRNHLSQPLPPPSFYTLKDEGLHNQVASTVLRFLHRCSKNVSLEW